MGPRIDSTLGDPRRGKARGGVGVENTGNLGEIGEVRSARWRRHSGVPVMEKTALVQPEVASTNPGHAY